MKHFNIVSFYEGQSLLTGVKCLVKETGGGVRIYEDSVCGNYAVTADLKDAIDDDRIQKERLVFVLSEKSRRYGKQYLLTLNGGSSRDEFEAVRISDFLSNYPASALDKLDRALINLSWGIDSVGDSIDVEVQKAPYLYALDYKSALGILEELQALGFIFVTRVADGILYQVRIISGGWRRLQFLEAGNLESTQAFLAMWFDAEMDSVAKVVEETVCAFEGFTCRRIDQKEHNNKICDEIVAEIKCSRFLIADFTGNRGGVYFEAGFALGLGIPVIWTVREDHLDQVHFDTNHYNHITYSNPEELRKKLQNRIRATIL